MVKDIAKRDELYRRIMAAIDDVGISPNDALYTLSICQRKMYERIKANVKEWARSH